MNQTPILQFFYTLHFVCRGKWRGTEGDEMSALRTAMQQGGESLLLDEVVEFGFGENFDAELLSFVEFAT